MRKFLIFIIVIAVVLAGGYFLLNKNQTATEIVNPTDTAVAETTYEWVFKEGETGSSGVPNTIVSLKVNGKSYPLNDYDGDCAEVKSGEKGVLGEKADTNEISRIQCWFAGSGYELGVFKEGSKMNVKVGDLSEGIEGSKAFRGNFKTILSL